MQVHPAHHGVEQCEQSEKRDEHRADVERQMQAIDGPAGNGAENVGFFLAWPAFAPARR